MMTNVCAHAHTHTHSGTQTSTKILTHKIKHTNKQTHIELSKRHKNKRGREGMGEREGVGGVHKRNLYH